MKKWAITAVIYLLAVTGGYTAYDVYFNKEEEVVHGETATHEEVAKENHEKEAEHGHEGGEGEEKTGEVKTNLQYQAGKITITLEDVNGKPVDELQVNHEKLLHLIVVNNHLDQYEHLHPEKVGKGKFEIAHALKDGSYKAFIDIKPEKLNYHVTPVAFAVGEQHDAHGHNSLEPDGNLTKTVDGKTAEMVVSTLTVGKPVTLDFKLEEASLEPYLGAAGHVVILDEEANQYLHVHPLNENEPVFETQFDKPGTYKIWAEFKQAGKVRVFPYVIIVK
jgi:nitrogen fixation protein FixH